MITCIFLFFAVIFGREIPDEQNLALNEKAYLANTNLEFTNATNHGCDVIKGLKGNELYYIDLRKIRHILKIAIRIDTESEQSFGILVENQNSNFDIWISMGEQKTGVSRRFGVNIYRRYVGFKLINSLESVRICDVSIAGMPEELTTFEISWFEWTKNEDMFNLIKDRDSSTCVASHNAEAHHFHLYIPHGDTVTLTGISARCITGVEGCQLEYATPLNAEPPNKYCKIGSIPCSNNYLRNVHLRSSQRNKHIIELCDLSFQDNQLNYYEDFKWVQNHDTSLLSDGNTQSCLVTPWLFVNGALIVLPLFRRLNFIRIYATCKIEQKDCEYKVLIGDKSFDCERGWCEHTFTQGLVKFIRISFVEKAEFEVCEVSFEKMVTTKPKTFLQPTTTKQKGHRTLIPKFKTFLQPTTTIQNETYTSKVVLSQEARQAIILILIAVVCATTLFMTVLYTQEIKKYEANISIYRNRSLIDLQNTLQNNSKNNVKNDLQVDSQNNLQEDAYINVGEIKSRAKSL